MSELLDKELEFVRQAQTKQSSGLVGLYQLHADRLYRQVIFPCLADESASEDILKETFIVVMKQIQSYEWDQTKGVFPWLARIARNRALDLHRKRTREHRGNGVYRQELDLLAPEKSPDQILEEHQEQQLLKQQIQSCLSSLNSRYRRALELRLFQELSREECAEQLDIQLSTFDVLFHRALRACRKIWKNTF